MQMDARMNKNGDNFQFFFATSFPGSLSYAP